MNEQHKHDHVAGKGGFWVRPNGSTVPVKEMAGHWDTAKKLVVDGEITDNENDPYGAAYDAGWVRISLGIGAGKFVVTCQDNFSPAALREAMTLMRHYQGDRPVADFEVKPSDANRDRAWELDYNARIRPDGEWPYVSEYEVDKAYRVMSRMLLERSKALRLAAADPAQGSLQLTNALADHGLTLRTAA